ncbi:MAG: hypothetical protein IT426_19125 [Pirellulales bacterium]|nr:hypothetical protein [Pirellulales bacterium]
MNAKNAMIRLLWKEYRLQRAFWICMGALGMLLQLLGALVRDSASEQLYWLFGVALGLPAFYALGCGATMFAGEHEAGTFDFQRGLPVPSPRFFFCNMLFGAASTGAMFLLLSVSAVLFCTVPAWIAHASLAEMPEGIWPTLFGFWGAAVLEFFAWSVLFSLLLKRPLVAAMLGVGVASAAAQSAARYTGFSLAPYVEAAPVRLAIAALVAVVDIYLGCRWFRGKSMALRFAKRKDAAAIASMTPDLPKKYVTFCRTMIRLSWQQVRQSVWAWAGLLLISAYVVYYFWSINKLSLDTWSNFRIVFFVFLAVPVSLLGIYVFYPDQRGAAHRFLTERGMKPGRLWLERQATGLAFTIALGVVLYFVLLVPINSQRIFFFSPIWEYRQYSYYGADRLPALFFWLTDFLMLFYFLILIYSIGQCAAMFLRSGILAAFAAIGISTLLLLWVNLMIFWGVPWQWSIAPWPLLFLLATRLRMSAWLLERSNFRSWLRPGMVILPMAAIAIAMPLYRVFSVPIVDPGFSPEAFWQNRKPTAAALETVAMYEKAYEGLEQYTKSLPHPVIVPLKEGETVPEPPLIPWKAFEPLSGYETKKVDALRSALELALEASKRPECDFYADYPYSRGNNAWHARELIQPLISRARQLEGEGKLDEALDYYLGVLRMKRQISLNSPYGMILGYETSVYARLPGWAARPGQTRERILAAIEALKKQPEDSEPIACESKYEYLRNRGILAGDRKFTDYMDNELSKQKSNYKREVNQFVLWERFFPWERYRALRILNELSRNNLHIIAQVNQLLELGEAVPFRDFAYYDSEPEFVLKNNVNVPPRINEQGYYLYAQIDTLVHHAAEHRAALVALAMEAWKLERGEYPPSLDALAGKYFDKLPADPFTGKPFRYFSQGLPDRLKDVRPWDRYGYYNQKIYLEENRPFLWSPGQYVVDRGVEEPPLGRYWIREYRDRRRGAHSEEEIWRSGRIFPLP